MTPDLQTTNIWIAVLAVAGAIQTLLLLGAAVGLFVTYRRMMAKIDAIEERHLAPLAARASLIIDDLQDMTARVRRVDDVVRAKVHGLENAAQVARHAISDRFWPIVGAARAVGACLRSFNDKPQAPVTVPVRAERATVA